VASRSRCLATLVDGKPAVAYRTSPGSVVKYMYAPNGNPESAEDWVYSIALTGIVWPRQLVDAGGKPALILDEEHLMIALASTTTPSDPSDWQVHEIDDHSWGRNPAAVVHDGSIMVCYRAGDGLRFARSSGLTPASSGDWQVHSMGLEDSDESEGIAIVVVGGNPAVCYYCKEGSNEYPVVYVRALVAEPDSADDWVRDEIESDSHSLEPVMLDIDDKPVIICTMNMYTDYVWWDPSLVCAAATSSTPDGPLDWTISLVDPAYSYIYSTISAALIEGQLCIAYCAVDYWPVNDYYYSLKFARAQPGIPLESSDWQTQPVETWEGGMADLGQLISADGQPLVIYDLDGDYLAGGVRCARLAE
jgi:hypothetical protein